ncbi:protein C3orf33 homolog isoform X3 [Bufo gargarizans]|uniref:protein C3orf33 homolog isoform X3 n=1 Tax=Bufo gargarizans TaxID=30331 RepID=UPI001CF49844|nr:protein C3orf33 homolog isoform X3 [Bufo gargarizans]
MAPGDGQSADNVIAKASGLLDSHLYILRNISTGLAIAGIVLCARSIRLVTKFTQAKDIPEQFIKKNVKLRGKVVCVTEETIEIDHIPISLPVLRSVQKKWHGQGSLLVRLAGVELTQDGKIWLQNNLQPSEMLWFQLLNREDSMLDCFVFINRGGFINDCLNVVLLKEGFYSSTVFRASLDLTLILMGHGNPHKEWRCHFFPSVPLTSVKVNCRHF